MPIERAVDQPAQRTGAFAMHDPHAGQPGGLGSLQILGHQIGALGRCEVVQIELIGEWHSCVISRHLGGDLVGRGPQISVDIVEIGPRPRPLRHHRDHPGQWLPVGTNGTTLARSPAGSRASRMPAISSGR